MRRETRFCPLSKDSFPSPYFRTDQACLQCIKFVICSVHCSTHSVCLCYAFTVCVGCVHRPAACLGLPTQPLLFSPKNYLPLEGVSLFCKTLFSSVWMFEERQYKNLTQKVQSVGKYLLDSSTNSSFAFGSLSWWPRLRGFISHRISSKRYRGTSGHH